MSDQTERAGDVELIACAAIKHKPSGMVICAPRHGGLMHKTLEILKRLGFVTLGVDDEFEQGFVTNQFDKFVTREEAFIIAQKAGQIRYRCGGDDGYLFSENLY